MWFEDRSWSNNLMKSGYTTGGAGSSIVVEEEWRDIWSSKREMFIAALAYVFATTNLLNFPRLVLDNGGFAFIVAYAVALLVVILPILVLELAVGQLTGRAPIQAIYNISPVFKGVGLSQILFSLFVLACMTRFLAWIFLYIFYLFWTVSDDRPGLPWLHCKNFPEFHVLDGIPCKDPSTLLSPLNNTDAIFSMPKQSMINGLSTFHEDSALSHFMRAIEDPSVSIADVGQLKIDMLVAQVVVWIAVLVAICFGVRWLGKVIVFTFFVPLVLLAIFCGWAQFLDGAIDVYEPLFWMTTDWNKLADYLIWKTAIEQAILATGVGFGAFITIGSYNKRSNNLVADSILLVFSHFILTALQCTTVVALVGFVAHETGLSLFELISQGENQFYQILIYVSYLNIPKLFTGVILFVSAFVLLNVFYLLSLTILATTEDALGERWSRCFPRFALAFLVILVGIASSVFFATQAGKHAYELATSFARYITLDVILAFEIFAIAWIYCAHSLGKDLKTMLDSTCFWCFGHFLLFFNYLLPAIPIAIAVLNVLGYSFDTFSEPIRNWKWSEWCGLAIAVVPLLPIPLYAIFMLVSTCRNLPRISKFKRFCLAFQSPMHYELLKGYGSKRPSQSVPQISPRYSANAPGYVLLSQQAPLAQPEADNEAGTNVTMASSTNGHRGSTEHQQQHENSPAPGVFV